jgi:EmrB/QacA subfamily drug resistance transporter
MTATGSLVAPAAHTGHGRHSGAFRNAGRSDPKLVLLLAAGAVFAAALDLTVVSVAFPDLRADFPSASLPTLSWVVTVYAVLSAALLVPAGRIADVIGRRKLFAWSVAAFTVTSAFASVAPNEEFLILFRALQGVAAAGMTPAALGLVLTWTPPERLMAAIGVWGASALGATAIGPALGGALVDAWGWRAIFLVNVPIGLAVLYATMTRLARDAPSGRRLPDPVGTLFLAAGTGAVVVGLSQGSEWGWTSASILLAMAGGVLGVGAGLVRSARHPAPALELELWRDRTFTVANIATALFSATAYGSSFIAPLVLTATWDYSVLEAGLATTPGAIAGSVGAVVAGRRATTPAGRRATAVAGSLLVAAGSFYLWAQFGTERRFLEVILPANLVAGFGFGVGMTGLFGAGAASVPPTQFASGSGLLSMTRQLGGALGVAAVAAILAAPGYADAVEAYLAAFLFFGVAGVVAAAAGVGLLRADAAADDAAADDAGSRSTRDAGSRSTRDAGSRSTREAMDGVLMARVLADRGGTAGAGLRGRVAAALVGLAALAGVGVFAVTANVDEAPPPGPQAAAVSEAPQPPQAPQAPSNPVPASRSLVLIDVSASMGRQAGAGQTWLQAVTGAVSAGVGPGPESTEVGIWVVGSHFQGDRDWAELLPVGPLGEQIGPATRRQLIQSGLGRVSVVPDDRVGLYDSVLAAFQAMNSTYQPDQSNKVVVFTDGENDDTSGITLENLIAVLGDEFNPARPVQVDVISLGGATGDDSATGDGGGADRGVLTRIAEATRGGVYAADSPQQVREFFRTAA